MPSVSQAGSRLLGAGALVMTVGLLTGCTTTQQVAARERLNAARQVAAQTSTVVRQAGTSVDVTRVAAIAAAGSKARSGVVVSLRNTTARPLSDLPISVGYALGGRRVYLNGSDSLGYFDSHLPLITAHGQITWVFTSRAKLPAGARLFALVGKRATVGPGVISSVPQLSAEAAGATGAATDETLNVQVHNRSGIPQYQLQIYAFGTQGGRVVSGGDRTVAYIGSGSIQTVKIRLAGVGAGSALHVEALATTYR